MITIKNAKINTKVKWTRRNGKAAEGVIHSKPDQRQNGIWVAVRTGYKIVGEGKKEKKVAETTLVRLATLDLM